jgi:hypothetical protein
VEAWGTGGCVIAATAKVDIWRGPFEVWGFSACLLCVNSFRASNGLISQLPQNLSDFGRAFSIATAKWLGYELLQPLMLRLRLAANQSNGIAGAFKERREAATAIAKDVRD